LNSTAFFFLKSLWSDCRQYSDTWASS
jgi:hypothetical protein